MTFSENDIRPRRLDDLRYAAQAQDIAWLHARRDRFGVAACPACGDDAGTDKFEKHGFAWRECTRCGTAYMTPRPPADLLAEFYARSELYTVWNEHIFPSSEAVRRERIFKPRAARMVELIDRLQIPALSLFEIGAAHGIFCDEARKTGRFSRIVAVEPSSAQAQTCRRLNIETIESTIEQVEGQDGAADVVAAFEVIEHLSDPGNFVRSAKRLLRPGGLLLLSTPNVKGFEIATLGGRSDSVYPEHVSLFSPVGMTRMIENAGLSVLEFTTPGVLDCDIVRGKALAGTIDLSDQPFLRAVLLDRWHDLGRPFQTFLSANRQSSHMWFAAQREH